MTSFDTTAQAAGDREKLLADLRQFSSPSVLNGLKRLGLKPAEMQPTRRHQIRAMAPELGARTGIAVTRTMATHRDERPADGARARELGAAFDALTASIDSPKFLVVENVGGIEIATGDLLHGDEHGVVKIPWELAPLVPDAIRAHEAVEREVIAVCQSGDFSPQKLAAAWASGPSHY